MCFVVYYVYYFTLCILLHFSYVVFYFILFTQELVSTFLKWFSPNRKNCIFPNTFCPDISMIPNLKEPQNYIMQVIILDKYRHKALPEQ